MERSFSVLVNVCKFVIHNILYVSDPIVEICSCKQNDKQAR